MKGNQMSYEKYKDTIKATNKARRDALKLLVLNHQEEFDDIYREVAKNLYHLNTTKVDARVSRRTAVKEEI